MCWYRPDRTEIRVRLLLSYNDCFLLIVAKYPGKYCMSLIFIHSVNIHLLKRSSWSIIDRLDGESGKTWGLVENTGVMKLFSCLFFFPSLEYLPPLDARCSEYSKIRYAFCLFQSYFYLTWSKRFHCKSMIYESLDKQGVISL